MMTVVLLRYKYIHHVEVYMKGDLVWTSSWWFSRTKFMIQFIKFKLFTGVLPLTILVSLMAITLKLIVVKFKRYSKSSIVSEREQEFIWKRDRVHLLFSLFKSLDFIYIIILAVNNTIRREIVKPIKKVG